MREREPKTLDVSGVTRYGASAESPERAAAVLRARVGSAGGTLGPASRLDLAAAVVGVDAWMAVTGAHSLERPGDHGAAAVAVLSASLCRAGGATERHLGPLEVEACAGEDHLVAAAEGYARWATHHLGCDAPVVLQLAAADLAANGPTGPFAAMAELLVIIAEELAHAA